MTESDPKHSVQDEQFGKSEDMNVNDTLKENSEEVVDAPANQLIDNLEEIKALEVVSEVAVDAVTILDKQAETEATESVISEDDLEISSIDDLTISEDEPRHEEHLPLPSLKEIDYASLSKEEMVETLRNYISEFPLERIRNHVEIIKSVFYKKHNDEIEDIRQNFINDGGHPEDFKVEDSPVEINMKELLNLYRDRRNDMSKNLEEQKETNLHSKQEIIDSIKELVNSQESLNKTFHDFRNLQEKWRELGPVPQKNVKDLWESYHYHVEAFYDYIKINKELRDLDFKKNLDAKISLCEKAESLLLETSVVEEFRQLQLLHDQWREIGPVPAEKRNELWERFREATAKINHRHQEYFVKLKDEQKKNFQEKTMLCDKAEEISIETVENAKDWEDKSRQIIELQKVWKTIGFAPKKHNTRIYERFRAACDKFFDKKREFFASNKEEQDNNLQLKTELCIQAEAMQNSTDWKKTTNELIKLQKSWKAIGPVPVKISEKIWKRFRAACDTFFANKSKFYETIDSRFEENLAKKRELIQKIESFVFTSDVQQNLNQLQEFQREWSEIGFVPIKEKDDVQEKYRMVLNVKFDALKLDDEHKSILKFKSRVESIASKPNSDKRLTMERDKCYTRVKQLESDITLWENNIGFFANSKNAQSMIADVEEKIKAAKLKIVELKERIDIIDDME